MVLSLLISSHCYARELRIGDDAPDFKQRNLIKTKEFKFKRDFELKSVLGKKVVLINFFSTKTLPSLALLPELYSLYDTYKDKGLYLVSVYCDKEHPAAVARKSRAPAVLWDRYGELKRAYEVVTVPATVIIGYDGKIKYYLEGYKSGDEEDIHEAVDKLIK